MSILWRAAAAKAKQQHKDHISKKMPGPCKDIPELDQQCGHLL